MRPNAEIRSPKSRFEAPDAAQCGEMVAGGGGGWSRRVGEVCAPNAEKRQP